MGLLKDCWLVHKEHSQRGWISTMRGSQLIHSRSGTAGHPGYDNDGIGNNNRACLKFMIVRSTLLSISIFSLWSMGQIGGVHIPILDWGTEVQRGIYLPKSHNRGVNSTVSPQEAVVHMGIQPWPHYQAALSTATLPDGAINIVNSLFKGLSSSNRLSSR